MARNFDEWRGQRPALFLAVRDGDPPREVVRALSDIGILPYSRAKIEQGPTPEALVTDPISGRPGLILQIRGWKVSTDRVVILDVFYGVSHSLLTITLVGDRWQVSHEEVVEVIVASVPNYECASNAV